MFLVFVIWGPGLWTTVIRCPLWLPTVSRLTAISVSKTSLTPLLWQSRASCWSTLTFLFQLCLMARLFWRLNNGGTRAFCWERSFSWFSRKHLRFLRDLKMTARNIQTRHRRVKLFRVVTRTAKNTGWWTTCRPIHTLMVVSVVLVSFARIGPPKKSPTNWNSSQAEGNNSTAKSPA